MEEAVVGERASAAEEELADGGAGVHVPYHLTWAAERVEKVPEGGANFFQIKTLRELPAVVRTWAAGWA